MSDLLLHAAMPAIILSAGAIVLLLVGTTRWQRGRLSIAITGATLLAALAALYLILVSTSSLSGQQSTSLRLDRYAVVFDVILLVLAGLVALVAERRLELTGLERPEFYALMLFATAGATLMAGAGDLLIFFLGLEIMSVASYVLAGFARRDPASTEAALKYFILGSLASAILLMGIALLYGATGSTHFSSALHWIGQPTGLPLWLGGLVLLLVGIGFKVGLAPFHTWLPDAYDGAPLPATTFMASVVKVAAFAPLLRFAAETASHRQEWGAIIGGLATLSMLVGNLGALQQRNLKRLLAYSSIAQAGYLTLAVWAADASSLVFYLVAYAFASVGAFGMLTVLAPADDDRPDLSLLTGLGKRRPLAALCMGVFMLSLGGLPVTAGLIGKIFLFRAALQVSGPGSEWGWPLAIAAALASFVSVAYYLRIVGAMYLHDPADAPSAPSSAPPPSASPACLSPRSVTMHFTAPSARPASRWARTSPPSETMRSNPAPT